MRIKVSTDRMIEAAGMTVSSIDRIADGFEQIESRVRGASNYWEGKGHSAYLRSFNKRNEKIRDNIEWFRQDFIKLEQMAGIYQSAESEITESTESLPVDVIV